MSLENEFIPYEQALALKELGFDEPCFGRYGNYSKMLYKDYSKELHSNWHTIAPLYQQAFRWFREKYDLDYSIKPVYGEKHYKKHRCNVYSKKQLVQVMKYYFPDNPYFDSREEAELKCLKKLIEIVKEK
jgi:hypothetical protein